VAHKRHYLYKMKERKNVGYCQQAGAEGFEPSFSGRWKPDCCQRHTLTNTSLSYPLSTLTLPVSSAVIFYKPRLNSIACSVFIRTLLRYLTLTLRHAPTCHGSRREPNELTEHYRAESLMAHRLATPLNFTSDGEALVSFTYLSLSRTRTASFLPNLDKRAESNCISCQSKDLHPT